MNVHLSRIVSINVGIPQILGSRDAADDNNRPWTTAFFKSPVAGPVHVTNTGIIGDGQADRENHGGIDKAVLAYSADHYSSWRRELNLPDMPFGGFGENLTVQGLDENTVCIGDRGQAGDVMFQVSQPRQPCWKMSRRWRIADLAQQVIHNGRSGWYLRVLSEGNLTAGTSLTLVERPHPDWTIARASRVMHHDKHNLAAAAALASLPELSASWRETLLARVERRRGAPSAE